MKKLFFLSIICSCMLLNSKAQTSNKLKFTSIANIGVAAGGAENELQLQAINGLTYKTFSAGLGVGLDYYYKRTIPLFFDLRKDVFKKKQTPFVYADLGTNLPWIKKDKENSWSQSEYERGLYYDLGIGYKLPLSKKFFVNVSFGYSENKLTETTNQQYYWGFFDYRLVDGNNNYKVKNDYTFRRWSLKMGLSF